MHTCARTRTRAHEHNFRFYIPCIEKYELRIVFCTHNIELYVKKYTCLSKYYILNIYYIHIYIIYYEEKFESNVGTYLPLFHQPRLLPVAPIKSPCRVLPRPTDRLNTMSATKSGFSGPES
nr:MAG TPA: hypothetical protein [Caudoviricetes sp.]